MSGIRLWRRSCRVTEHQAHGLFVLQQVHAIIAERLYALDLPGRAVWQRHPLIILFNIHRFHVESCIGGGWRIDTCCIDLVLEFTPDIPG